MARRIFLLLAVGLPLLLLLAASVWIQALWGFLVVGPFVALGVYDLLQQKHSLNRIYPVIGHGRYLMEAIRPEIQQYFVETNVDGRPFSREFRSLIYQRAKGDRDTVPFGTQHDVDRVGYEWMIHSLAPAAIPETAPRITIGGSDCRRPYSASYLNISAMSYGALGRNAVRALNEGARAGGFAHNTGEGGVSPYHLEGGGDLIWQVGTGYFGCRTREGHFDARLFEETAAYDAIKMIEIKLSQGAKPGHGGILPAAKVTDEIAEIRHVPMGRDVVSPPAHTAFATPAGLLEFVAKLRELTGGKPIGFKLCVGVRSEFLGICKAMVQSGIVPDFITVDGAEGGTGAAPVEFSNSVGMPMRDGVLFVHNALTGFGLRSRIRTIAAGKIASGFHMVRALALGADLCNSARGMMFALGCIQARRCNTNTCPVGITTQALWRNQGLVVADKASRVARYHGDTIESFVELIAVTGCASPDEIGPQHVLRRLDATNIRPLDQVYEYLPADCLVSADSVPGNWVDQWERADANRF